MITGEIDITDALDGLGKLRKEYSQRNFLERVGQFQVSQIQQRIIGGKADPSGLAWSPWSPMRANERADKGNAHQGLLWDTGNLLRNIKYKVVGNTVEIGVAAAAVPYAYELQYGRTGGMAMSGDSAAPMPPRPFVGWEPDWTMNLQRIFLQGALK